MKILFANSLFFLSISFAFAQNVLNAKSPEELRDMNTNRYTVNSKGEIQSTVITPIPFGYIEDKDILWSRVTWEIIDLNEKINQIYQHSTDGLVSSNLSLFEALREGIKSGRINEVYTDEYFSKKMDPKQAIDLLSSTRVDKDYLQQLKDEGKKITKEIEKSVTDVVEVHNKDIKLLKIKGMWYMDKRLGQMKYRLLGLCIMGPDAQTYGRADIVGANDFLDLFWIWYEDARSTLVNYKVFNPQNNSAPVTYDDLLNVRRFNSIVYKIENGKGDGTIRNYLPRDAKEQLSESNKSKEKILNYENNLWNY